MTTTQKYSMTRGKAEWRRIHLNDTLHFSEFDSPRRADIKLCGLLPYLNLIPDIIRYLTLYTANSVTCKGLRNSKSYTPCVTDLGDITFPSSRDLYSYTFFYYIHTLAQKTYRDFYHSISIL